MSPLRVGILMVEQLIDTPVSARATRRLMENNRTEKLSGN